MAKFKVGDKVRVIDNLRSGERRYMDDSVAHNAFTSEMVEFAGKVVTIRSLERDVCGMEYRIEEDNGIWFWVDGMFSGFATEQPRREFIVIRRSGAETIAELRHDREVIKSAKATCAPSDAFDLDTGAKLAFDRLMGREADKDMPRCKIPEPAPQSAHRFKVGDRVLVKEYGTIGEVSAIDATDDSVPYLVYHEEGIHSGGSFAKPSKFEHKEKCSWFGDGQLSPAPAPEPPKFYTGKVVCVEWKVDCFRHTSAGRIAMVTNGISDYIGWNRIGKPFESFSDFCSSNNFGVFYEIKE